MKLPVALAIVAGVVGGILTYLYVGPLAGLGLFIPATFIGAASYFAAGGELAGLQKSVIANIWGIAWGTIALILIGLVSNPLMIGLIVGACTLVMILGALLPALGFVPGAVLGLATTAGFGLLTEASGTDFSLPTGPFTVMLLSFVIGGLYGFVGSIVVGKMVKETPAEVAADADAA